MAPRELDPRFSGSPAGIESLTADFHGDTIWNFVDGFSRNYHVLREPTAPSYARVLSLVWNCHEDFDESLTAQSNEPVVITAIDVSLFTRVTCTVVYDWLNNYSGSHLDVMYIFTYLFDRSTEFVS